ncbi:unnamed protein product [Adineta ricciae]|uniref:EGF-like domain-containing protein n=1 Tax=Adineta ricciae TaxID=249248 RepID=A0A816GY22_ADIRI|nr:unnamed protein product [Adineta ricciae]
MTSINSIRIINVFMGNTFNTQYCHIPYTCTCSLDSICAGIDANNRSICVCRNDRFGSECLLTNTVCQRNPCLNGGVCVSSEEYITSRSAYVCICKKGYNGKHCEEADSKVIVLFPNNFELSVQSSVMFHFINFVNRNLHIHHKSPAQLCNNITAVTNYWSHPFNTVFIQLPTGEYYFILNEQMDSPSTLVRQMSLTNRCPSITEIFPATIIQMPRIQRIKHYHVPCWNRTANISCFYDESLMCLCGNLAEQRLANCFDFNHRMKINDLALHHNQIPVHCETDSVFNTTTSTPRSTSTTRDSGTYSIYTCQHLLYFFISILYYYILYTQ